MGHSANSGGLGYNVGQMLEQPQGRGGHLPQLVTDPHKAYPTLQLTQSYCTHLATASASRLSWCSLAEAALILVWFFTQIQLVLNTHAKSHRQSRWASLAERIGVISRK